MIGAVWHDRDVKSPAGEDRGPRVALFGVGAFTDRPFGGNPAMVCLLPEPADDGWMRRAAAELNQPATAFLHDRRPRWFTSAGELPLCGHATLANAHVLYEAGPVAAADPIFFEAASGPLRVLRQRLARIVAISRQQVMPEPFETRFRAFLLRARGRHGGVETDADSIVQELIGDPHPGLLPVPGHDPFPRPGSGRVHRSVTRRAMTFPPPAISSR